MPGVVAPFDNPPFPLELVPNMAEEPESTSNLRELEQQPDIKEALEQTVPPDEETTTPTEASADRLGIGVFALLALGCAGLWFFADILLSRFNISAATMGLAKRILAGTAVISLILTA